MTEEEKIRKYREDECREYARMLGESVAGIRQLDLQELDTLYGLLRQSCISLGWVP